MGKRKVKEMEKKMNKNDEFSIKSGMTVGLAIAIVFYIIVRIIA